ncbi:ABC transporter substrate-binding protein [Glutamicibacter sp. MNS18]|uniref:ABC transporter substrate-binding protein n=1 Tax=Glutamicibacter sp. MNS18 TaxID=2989817 RepID=UPI002235DB60|nr:ABC transporter substrate-binding protein [Glutamicibacter sp. MNS18]MCW4466832.1 ABC transporter substrate-binding protein [Glutamicibacter sp. MNS18]
MRTLRIPGLLFAIASSSVLLLSATACSGSSSATIAPEEQSLTVGYFPLVHTATAVHADNSGIFEEEGLDIKLTATQGGATAVPSLVSGNIDVIYTNYTSVLLAAHQGIELSIISGNDIGSADHGIFVSPDSGISSLSDLKGKTFAVNNLQNIGTIAIRAQLESAGLEASDLDIVEMPYPDMASALENGIIDAAWQVEPFQAGATANGLVKIGDLFAGPVEDMPVAGWVTTRAFAEQNPEAIEAFQESIARSAKDLQDNREALADLVPSYTKVSADVVEAIELPNFSSALDAAQLEKAAQLMHEHGIIDSPLDIVPLLAGK